MAREFVVGGGSAGAAPSEAWRPAAERLGDLDLPISLVAGR